MKTWFSPQGTEWKAETYEEALEQERDALVEQLEAARGALDGSHARGYRDGVREEKGRVREDVIRLGRKNEELQEQLEAAQQALDQIMDEIRNPHDKNFGYDPGRILDIAYRALAVTDLQRTVQELSSGETGAQPSVGTTRATSGLGPTASTDSPHSFPAKTPLTPPADPFTDPMTEFHS